MKQQSLNISFEFFPPKTDEGMANLQKTAAQLTAHQPEFFSVTFGAGGSTRDGTLTTVKMLQNSHSISVAPHLSCMGSTRQSLIDLLHTYQSLGVKRIVALRGDLPSGMGNPGELRYAYELVKLIRETTGDYFHIEVAAYPEIHPQAKTAQTDVLNFKNKILAGANSAITQYFFNADAYFYFRDECAKQAITVPIIPGIMPVTQFSKLLRFSELCGAEIPRWLCKRFAAYGDDQASIQALGYEVVLNLCQRLAEGGAPGFHFYTLNQGEMSAKLISALL